MAPTSRRALLGALTSVPVTALAAPATSPWTGTLTKLDDRHDDQLPDLVRSKDGRALSRFRYHNAESFFLGIDLDVGLRLYETGIVLQLGLSAHLLDVGFADRWCARHIGLHVAWSLGHANATGLGLQSADLELLAAMLSPYGKWRHADVSGAAADFPFSPAEVRALTRALLDRVREVTGHPRPRGHRSRLLASGSEMHRVRL